MKKNMSTAVKTLPSLMLVLVTIQSILEDIGGVVGEQLNNRFAPTGPKIRAFGAMPAPVQIGSREQGFRFLLNSRSWVGWCHWTQAGRYWQRDYRKCSCYSVSNVLQWSILEPVSAHEPPGVSRVPRSTASYTKQDGTELDLA
ncbi:hypothetical protein BX600DRAFT_280478 [Xylariales sp. PMI_506]|nr:hypothetical protein BX600DRAFT_280478 [Xylariales sp. PMI_506]